MRNWAFKNPDPALVREISAALDISAVLGTLLVNRGVKSILEAKKFLKSGPDHLHNPFLLPNMERAVLRARKAIDKKEKILIYGDRDVDGVTSLAILVRTLKSLGADVLWAVPGSEGHGVHASILERYAKEGVSLVVTVDCGTSSVEEIRFANSIGLDVIVTDHHTAPEILPEALAIVNPNLRDSLYPCKHLAGCLTAFKFAQALMFSFNRTFAQDFVVLDIETTGLSPTQDSIVEVAAIRIRNFVLKEKFHSLVHPGRPIPPDVSRIHGITDEMVEDAPSFAEVLPRLLDFFGDAPLVAHNAGFDLGFIRHQAKKILDREIKNPSVDTLFLARSEFSYPSHSLTFLVDALNIDRAVAHRAMEDCLATAALFQKIEEARDPRLAFFVQENLDLVALGTIADVVPLLEENRVVVKHGIPRLLETRKPGLKALLKECGIGPGSSAPGKIPSAKDISWTITPHLNAAGRFERADLTARLLLTESEDEARDLVAEIAKLNRDRRSLQKFNLEKFLALVGEQCDLEKDRILFVVAEGIEHGVTGIVASQLVREFSRPAFLLIRGEDGTALGSSRSIPSFNVVEALKSCEDLLVKYGGHPAAAGLTVDCKNLDALKARLKKIGEKQIGREQIKPLVEIDLEISLKDSTKELLQEVSLLEPFGQGNPAPIFALRGAAIKGISQVGTQKNHLKVLLGNETVSLSAVGWGMGDKIEGLVPGTNLDLAFHLEMDRWNGRENLQLLLVDFSTSLPDRSGKAQSIQLDLMLG